MFYITYLIDNKTELYKISNSQRDIILFTYKYSGLFEGKLNGMSTNYEFDTYTFKIFIRSDSSTIKTLNTSFNMKKKLGFYSGHSKY